MSNGKPQRCSVFSGLLLILVGVLFLLHYWAPGLVHLGRIARYWPVLLILWGLAKLYDHFAAERTGEAPPRALTGGEFLLLVLVLCFGLILLSMDWLHRRRPDLDISVGLFERPYTFTDELPGHPVRPGSQIAIVTRRGDITVRPEDTPEIRVIVSKTATASSEQDARRRAQEVHVLVHDVPGGYQVEPETKDEASGVKVNLEVHVPKRASVTAKTDRGKIQIADLAGAINATSGKGDVEIHNAGGDVSADLRGGDARIVGVAGNLQLSGRGGELELADVTGTVSIQGEFYGPIRLRNVAKTSHFLSSRTDLTVTSLPGRLEMDSGKLAVYDAPGSVSLTTKNKDVEMDNISGRIRIEDRHGDIEVRLHQALREEVSIANDSGSVDLALPPNSSFEISAVSRSGDVQSDFQGGGLKLTQDSENSRLEGKVGARGPKITITTSYGTIHIRKAT